TAAPAQERGPEQNLLGRRSGTARTTAPLLHARRRDRARALSASAAVAAKRARTVATRRHHQPAWIFHRHRTDRRRQRHRPRRAKNPYLSTKPAAPTDADPSTHNKKKKKRTFPRRSGPAIKSLPRRSAAQVLRHNPSDTVRQLLELRRAGARASTRKFDALLA